MGDPELYYREFLQTLAYHIFIYNDEKLAMNLKDERSVKKLEDIILDQKSKLSDKDFYYAAGKATGYVVKRVDVEDGTDGFNACIGGFCEFEHFIGIRDDDDDD